MRPIIKWTLRQRRWSIFWWVIGIVVFLFINLVFYPTIKSQTAELNKSFESIPETARQLFTDTGDLFSPIGYLSSQIFYLMLPLLLGILAINLGMSLVGKEEHDNTIELLLARPVSRAKLMFGKALAGLIILVLVAGISALFTAVMCKLVGLTVPVPFILEAGLAVTLMALAFGSVALLLTALGRAGRAASIGFSAVFALGGYIVVSLSSSISWLSWPAKIFPFNYYHSSELLTGTYNWANVLFFIGVSAGCLAVSWLAFRRRDIVG